MVFLNANDSRRHLIDGRVAMVLDGLTPVETLRELFRRHAIAMDPSAPASLLVEAISQIDFDRHARGS